MEGNEEAQTMGIRNTLKAFANFIRHEAKDNLDAHLTPEDYFYYEIPVGDDVIFTQGYYSQSSIQSEYQRVYRLFQHEPIGQRKTAYKKILSVLKIWKSLGYVPAQYRTKLAAFYLRDVFNTKSEHKLLFPPDEEHTLAIINRLENFSMNKGQQKNKPKVNHDPSITTFENHCVSLAWRMAKIMDIPLFVWSFDQHAWHYQRHYQHVAIGEYLADFIHHPDFVLLRAGKKFCVMHKEFCFSIGGCHDSQNQAMAAAKKALTHHTESDYQRAINHKLKENAHARHHVILDAIAEENNAGVSFEEESAFVVQFENLNHKTQLRMLSDHILASQKQAVY